MNTDFYPKTPAEIFDHTIYIYKQAFGKHLAFASIFGIIFFVLFFFMAVFAAIALAIVAVYAIAALALDLEGGSFLIGLLLSGVVVAPIYFIWLSVSSAGHILLARQTVYGHRARLQIRELPGVAARIFLTLLGVLIISTPFVFVMVAAATSGFVAFLLYNFPWVFFVLLLIFAAAYLLFTNIYSLAIVVTVCEKKTFFTAILRSWALVKGEFWKIAGMRLVWFFAALAIWAVGIGALSLITALVDGAIGTGVANFAVSSVITGILAVVSALFSTVIFFVIIPLDGIFHTALYYNQRIKREGLDIEIRLGRLRI